MELSEKDRVDLRDGVEELRRLRIRKEHALELGTAIEEAVAVRVNISGKEDLRHCQNTRLDAG